MYMIKDVLFHESFGCDGKVFSAYLVQGGGVEVLVNDAMGAFRTMDPWP